MAEKANGVEDYLTCAVCLEKFTDPVTLGCYHSFCHSCLKGTWAKSESKTCPTCRRKSSKDNLLVNFAMKELCISVKEKDKTKRRSERRSEVRFTVCSLHPQVPPLFCKDEGQILCALCEFSLHRDHTVVSLEEAEPELKQPQRLHIQALEKQKEDMKSMEQLYKDVQQHLVRQAQHCERHIRAEFERLHRFLKEEEELRLTALRTEQQTQTQRIRVNLGSISESLASLEKNIQELEKQMQLKTEDFIHVYKSDQSQPPLAQKPLPRGSTPLLNQGVILGNLAFRVWKKMATIVQYSPVILDPNTASPNLLLSDDLTSLRRSAKPLYLPDNPERFQNASYVLGVHGFKTGKHQWEVEVGDYPDWILGVAKESVNTKPKAVLSPEDGVWALAFLNNMYWSFSASVNFEKRPQTIQIQLDCDEGTLSFYDPTDMSLIYTIKEKFTERLFPFFYVARPQTVVDLQMQSIRICQNAPQISV